MSPKANTAPRVSSPADLRNVVLVGSAGSGKTTLFENVLRARIPGYRGERDDPERTAALTLATVTGSSNGHDVVINLLDAPGHPDFVGELRAGLRAADAAVFVVSAADGIDATTATLWRECQAANMPRAIAITKLDTERASFDSALSTITGTLGAGAHPAYLPLQDASGDVIGNMSLLTGHVHDYSSGTRQTRPANDDEQAQIEQFRTDYLESIITESEDDDLLERYFEGEDLPSAEVVADLLKAMRHASFFPVIPVLTNGVGTEELIGIIAGGFPYPGPDLGASLRVHSLDGAEVPDPGGDPDGPLLAQVIRTTADPYAGRLSMVRVFSGTLQPDVPVHVSGRREQFTGIASPQHPDHDDEERVGLLSSPAGVELAPRQSAIAGEIVMVAKLAKTETGDTLSDRDHPMVIEPWALPEPLLPLAIRAASRNDEDKLANALARLAVEDPTVRVERDQNTDQQLLWTMGQAHMDLLLNRLRDRYQVNVEVEPIKTPLRETFIVPAQGHGRHVKQSGGHGQYAVCDIRVEPGERGSGFTFVDEVVGGAVPRQFIPSVEKGVRAQMERGTLSDYPMVDVKVTLYDGKSHPVDSSDMAFQSAGALALKEAASRQTVALLEPIDEVRVSVADEYLGAVMTDLGNRRGQVLGTDAGEQEGTSVVRALVPQSELARYAIDLRGLARGTGSFTRTFHGYELMPANLAQEHMKA